MYSQTNTSATHTKHSAPAVRTSHSLFERLEARRESKYLRRVNRSSTYLRGWRNQRARRRLVVTLEIGMALLLLSGFALIASFTESVPGWFGVFWPVVTLMLMLAWSLLNITVDMIDSAPDALLDEYQREQLFALRALTYRCYNIFGIVFFLALILVGTNVLIVQAEWGFYAPYTFGIIGMVGLLFISTLPTVVYAWNLKDD